MVVAIARMLLWAAIAQIRLRSRPTVSPGSHPIRGPHSPGLRQQLRLETPVLAMTASAIRDGRKRCLEVGMNDYMLKPFELQEFFERVTRLLPGKTLISSYRVGNDV